MVGMAKRSADGASRPQLQVYVIRSPGKKSLADSLIGLKENSLHYLLFILNFVRNC